MISSHIPQRRGKTPSTTHTTKANNKRKRDDRRRRLPCVFLVVGEFYYSICEKERCPAVMGLWFFEGVMEWGGGDALG